jgi:branched-chain amino acid transport system substrate-binding protein
MKRLTAGTLALAAAAAMGAAWTAGGIAAPDKKDIVIGAQCDRTGATQLVGVSLCPAILDYINLVNSKGGVEGYKIKLEEIDNEYKVPPAIEAYEKQKADGAVSIMLYGTP